SMTVTASTLSGNSAALEGSAVSSEMQLTLVNVTVSGNSVAAAVDYFDGPLTLTNVTIAQNTGTGLAQHAASAGAVTNTLLASNSAGNCSGTIASKGFNLSDDNTCISSFNQAGEQNN